VSKRKLKAGVAVQQKIENIAANFLTIGQVPESLRRTCALLRAHDPVKTRTSRRSEMIGRRTVVGLALLSALLVCAFAAQSASAVAAKNTTAVTCVEGGAKDFSDAHCDNAVTAGTGKFGHVAIENGKATTISVTNAKTANSTTEAAPTVLKGTVFGVKNEITCKTVTGEGTLTNEEVGKEHKVKGTVTANFTSCTVNKPAIGCKVKEPITVKSNTEGVEELQGAKEKEKGEKGTEMGLEFKPTSGEVFNEVVIEGCFIAGTYKTTGTAIGTGTGSPSAKFSGATNVFTNAMTKETLKLAGNPAEVSSSTTVTMSGGGNPVALTTTT
jgi:hypothetical protein